jgi:hypothetical protein
MAKKDIDKPSDADIELEATVKSRKLRFTEVPSTKVAFHGDPGHESVDGTERGNLPEEVEPGVTYRDSWVRLRIASRLLEELPKE